MKLLTSLVFLVIFVCFTKANCEEPPRLNFDWKGSERTHFSQNTRDGGHIISGQFWTPGGNQYDFWVLKLNKDGTIAWQKTYGGGGWDIAFSSTETSDGGYIVSGTTTSFGSGNEDVWVLKLDSKGDVVWQKTYGGEQDEYSGMAQQTKDGGYLVAGTSSSFGDSKDIWILKLDSKGNVEWDKTYGDSDEESDWGRHIPISQTSDGGYIVAGSSKSFGAKDEDFWIFKLDKNGNILWQRRFGTDGEQYPTSIVELPDGTYRLTGTETEHTMYDDWILILDAKGNVIGVHSLENKELIFYDTSILPKETREKTINTNATAKDTAPLMEK